MLRLPKPNSTKYMKSHRLRNTLLLLCGGALIGVTTMIGFNYVVAETSTNDYCISCHIHPESDKSWKMSTHGNSLSGVSVGCTDCHLPPFGSLDYYFAKAKTGMKDMWSYMTKDSASFNWEERSQLEYAVGYVYNESCLKCHTNLFPTRMNDDGLKAHLYYEENAEALDLQCINCHQNVGHYDPNYSHSKMKGVRMAAVANAVLYDSATRVAAFESFTEYIPGTPVSFNMKAIAPGTFQMGSPDGESMRQDDEGPVREVTVSKFFMGETEVTWDQYFAFYKETMSEGRTLPEKVYANNSRLDVDAISGPTPPFGIPDQGWGAGERPAITMTYYGAQTFCQWLSKKTGKKYRLPTEAEWEYAARGGTQTPYFFEGKPSKFSNEGFWRSIVSADTAVITRYAIYDNNSNSRTAESSAVQANPFGLRNMSGNVMEYCLDWYAEDAYAQTPDKVTDPRGPASGTEHVVRGGDYRSDAKDLRSAARAATQHEAWLKTDPQQPKSIWWYSDIKGIGFRVVCEWEE